MSEQGNIDRRRERRVEIQVPIQIRRVGDDGPGRPEEGVTRNVSLAGVYFETERGQTYVPNDVVVASISIPEAQGREFPFTRLAGRSRVVRVVRVVRVDELPERDADGDKQQGIALEFGENLTVLSAIRS